MISLQDRITSEDFFIDKIPKTLKNRVALRQTLSFKEHRSRGKEQSAVKNVFGFLALLLVANWITACATIAETPEPINIRRSLPQNIRSVRVSVIPVNPAAAKNVEGMADADAILASGLREAFATTQPDWSIILASPNAVTESDLSVFAELTQIDGGSAGLRFWIGFNAGEARSTAKVTVRDKTGEEVASTAIMQRTMCPIGACVESNEAIVRRNLESLAKEIAQFVTNPAQYQQKSQANP